MKTIQVILGVDMRQGHPGLIKLAAKKGINLDALDPQTAVIFIARNKMRMKAYSHNGVLSYMRSTDSKRPFDLNAIDEFPKAFSKDGKMDYAKALRAKLEKELSKKGKLEEKQLK